METPSPDFTTRNSASHGSVCIPKTSRVLQYTAVSLTDTACLENNRDPDECKTRRAVPSPLSRNKYTSIFALPQKDRCARKGSRNRARIPSCAPGSLFHGWAPNGPSPTATRTHARCRQRSAAGTPQSSPQSSLQACPEHCAHSCSRCTRSRCATSATARRQLYTRISWWWTKNSVSSCR